jgi:F-type H+-transporting ATPase subunit alpha
VRRTGEIVRVPVGEACLGRVVNGLGEPIDGGPPLDPAAFYPVEREAPAIIDRQPVRQPLETGIKCIDVTIPIGRGQRELILGDRKLGKTTIAIDTILNQRGKDVLCVYVSVGQKSATAARVVNLLRERGAMDYTCVVVGSADDPPGLQFIAPYAGCSVAEYFMERGRDTLVVYDDLSKHADVYRELSLLLRRPPGREAYPGDVFYIHSRLLERSAKLADGLGGGSQTALPIVETRAQNIAAYIPTNLISITDGQLYLAPDLFNQGHRPAVDVGRSVSRIGGETQAAAMRQLGGPVRLEYSQFLELELFTKFGAQVERSTREAIERGRRIKEVLKQPPHDPWPMEEQVLVFFAAHEGLLDPVPVAEVAAFEEGLRGWARESVPEVMRAIASGRPLEGSARDGLREGVIAFRQRFLAGRKEAVRGAAPGA